MKFPDIINVTDQDIDITDFSQGWKKRLVVLSQKILTTYNASGKDRYVVVLGGPSGSGKSTSASLLKYILELSQNEIEIINISQDAYHYSNEYLINHSLMQHKGRHDTFDVDALLGDVIDFKKDKNISFPYYSRILHNPILNKVPVHNQKSILILEGLWLLYDKKPWSSLLSLCDYSIFIDSTEDFRKNNTIGRHVRGGRSLEDAINFYQTSDIKNTELILNSIAQHDLDFRVK